MSKCIYDNNGICDITERPCKDTVICTPETIYLEKESENNET